METKKYNLRTWIYIPYQMRGNKFAHHHFDVLDITEESLNKTISMLYDILRMIDVPKFKIEVMNTKYDTVITSKEYNIL